jgi:molecular chaperone HscB
MAILSKNFFQFFGLEPKLCVDADALQKRFYELSKQWHPDRFTRKSAEEQSEALEATSILNDGYRTLKDPVKRAEYLLKEEGFPIGEQRSKDVPPELLEEVFELNMMLEELKSGDSDARGQLETARGNFAAMQADVDKQLQGLFSKFDATKAGLPEIRGLLNRRRYIDNLLRDVDRALNPAAAAVPVEDRL